MKSDVENNYDNASNTLEVILNPNLQPLFSDHIFKIEIDENNTIAKLYLGHQIDNKLVHHSTIALPFPALLRLSKFFDSEEFKSDHKD